MTIVSKDTTTKFPPNPKHVRDMYECPSYVHMPGLKNIFQSPHLLDKFSLPRPHAHPCTSSKISQPGVGGRYFLSRPALISRPAVMKPRSGPSRQRSPFSTPNPEAHQPDPCPASWPKAPSPRGSVSRPGPGSQGLRFNRETGRDYSSGPDTRRAGRSGRATRSSRGQDSALPLCRPAPPRPALT